MLLLSLQSEDLNTLVGNAFRVAYAVQLQSEIEEQKKSETVMLEKETTSTTIKNESVLHEPAQQYYVLNSSKTQSDMKSLSSSQTNNNNQLCQSNKKGIFAHSRSVESLLSSNVKQGSNNSSNSMQAYFKYEAQRGINMFFLNV